MSLQYLKKDIRDEVDFSHADKHQSFLPVNFKILGIEASYKVILSLLMDMINHSQSTQSNKFAISLQYLKKKLGMEFIFCMQKNFKVSKSWHYCFRWKWLGMVTVPKTEKGNTFIIKRENIATAFYALLSSKIIVLVCSKMDKTF